MRKRLQGLAIGLLIGIIFTGSVVYAKTGTNMIEVVYQNVKLYVDGVLVTPKDANGNIVEPFISNGTTYLPVRALSEALGKDVRWDGKTSSVIIGLRPGEVVYFDDVLLPYKIEENDGYFQAGVKTGKYVAMAGVKYYHGVSNVYNYTATTGYYNTNAQYSQLSGMYGPRDGNTPKTQKIDIYGDGRIIKSFEFSNSDMPTDFSVDLSGVLQLKIVLTGGASIVNWQVK